MSKRYEDHPEDSGKTAKKAKRNEPEEPLPSVNHSRPTRVAINCRNPSHEKWAKKPYWTEREALFLILDFRPFMDLSPSEKRLLNGVSSRPEEDYYNTAISQVFTDKDESQYEEAQDLIRRTKSFPRWPREIEPRDFIDWASKKKLHVPLALKQAVYDEGEIPEAKPLPRQSQDEARPEASPTIRDVTEKIPEGPEERPDIAGRKGSSREPSRTLDFSLTVAKITFCKFMHITALEKFLALPFAL